MEPYAEDTRLPLQAEGVYNPIYETPTEHHTLAQSVRQSLPQAPPRPDSGDTTVHHGKTSKYNWAIRDSEKYKSASARLESLPDPRVRERQRQAFDDKLAAYKSLEEQLEENAKLCFLPDSMVDDLENADDEHLLSFLPPNMRVQLGRQLSARSEDLPHKVPDRAFADSTKAFIAALPLQSRPLYVEASTQTTAPTHVTTTTASTQTPDAADESAPVNMVMATESTLTARSAFEHI
ncbi:hypothetical protein P153DRAFT_428792 [Dothidotthia symphoricarpi CBS 119687]|uniref:Uncharacterized protein n=1 Tax=Dothidotthia symphoricarpi CBS 119687 TaxID=1392245 RepID=A0A6A6ANH6_9PLEO|nr:uncharacterized protein P153DRAFT_428792 [Dothidotthia symphoricarpi CBS 119687]KAF2132743.1 hypothetical protein P153DRAFT_428792 [Dothidotthia symphoricarpi CBS 119687]